MEYNNINPPKGGGGRLLPLSDGLIGDDRGCQANDRAYKSDDFFNQFHLLTSEKEKNKIILSVQEAENSVSFIVQKGGGLSYGEG